MYNSDTTSSSISEFNYLSAYTVFFGELCFKNGRVIYMFNIVILTMLLYHFNQ